MITINRDVHDNFERLALSHTIIDSVTVEKKSASLDAYVQQS